LFTTVKIKLNRIIHLSHRATELPGNYTLTAINLDLVTLGVQANLAYQSTDHNIPDEPP